MYHLELTGQPFEVARVIDDVLQASTDCQLPTLVPPTISLPTFPALPELECTYNVDIPLIPPPYFEGCIPTFSGGINVFSCNDELSVTGGATITAGAGGTCDFVLDGNIEICLPPACVPNFSGEIAFYNKCENSLITVEGGISVAYDTGLTGEECNYTLEGGLELCIPECLSVDTCGTLDWTASNEYMDLQGNFEVCLEECQIKVNGGVSIEWTGPEVCTLVMATSIVDEPEVNIEIVEGAELTLEPKLTAAWTGGPCSWTLELGISITGEVTGLSTKDITVCNGTSSETFTVVCVG